MSGKERILASLMIFFLAFALACGTCSNAAAEGMNNAQKASIKWRFATLAPKGIGWARQVEELLFPAVKKATANDLYVKVYWGGIMGNDAEALRKIRAGQLEGGGFTGQGTILACPEFSVVCLPFMFESYDEVDYIKAKLGPSMDKLMEKHGFKLFLWDDQDFDQLYSTKGPITRVQDFSGTKFVAWFGEVEDKTLTALGATLMKTSVPDARSLLRQGQADAALAPAAFVTGTQMYAVAKNFNPFKIRYSPAPIMVSVKAFNAAPKKYTDAMWAQRADLQAKFAAGLRHDNRKALDAMLQYGVRKAESSAKDLADLKRLTRPVWDELAGKLYPRDLLDELTGYLKDFRARNGR